jgi:putative transposase
VSPYWGSTGPTGFIIAVPKDRAGRRAFEMRAPILVEARPNARRTLDFVHDQFVNGRRFRILNIVDE